MTRCPATKNGSEHYSRSPAILVVDDDEGFRTTLTFYFRQKGYTITLACSGRRGLEALTHGRFDLVVLDMRLGDMFGTDMIKSVRRYGRQPPFILISGFLTTPDTVAAMELGAVDVLD